MRQRENPLGKPTKVDYLVMFGMPVAFVAIALAGIFWLLGPPPPKNPLQQLKNGAVSQGMTGREVEAKIGLPKSIADNASGGQTWRYQRGTDEPFVEEDGFVEFDSSGKVVNVQFEKTRVTPPGDSKK